MCESRHVEIILLNSFYAVMIIFRLLLLIITVSLSLSHVNIPRRYDEDKFFRDVQTTEEIEGERRAALQAKENEAKAAAAKKAEQERVRNSH